MNYGGTILTFATPAMAAHEAARIHDEQAAYGLFDSYNYVVGNSLVRVTNTLSEAQAERYYLVAIAR